MHNTILHGCRFLCSILIFLSIGPSICGPIATTGIDAGFSNQASSQTLTAKTGNYAATLKMRNFSAVHDSGIWHGADVERPKKVVASLEVRHGGTRVAVWRSAYCDLAEVNRISLTASGANTVLVINGGDAGASYTAKLYFAGKELKSRKVVDNSFPDNFYEDTRYVNIPVKL